MKESFLSVSLFILGIVIGRIIGWKSIPMEIIPIIIAFLFFLSFILKKINKKDRRSVIHWFNYCIIKIIILIVGYGFCVIYLTTK